MKKRWDFGTTEEELRAYFMGGSMDKASKIKEYKYNNKKAGMARKKKILRRDNEW